MGYNFDRWVKENKGVILEEQRKLNNNGHNGDIRKRQNIQKCYYFKIKATKIKKPKKKSICCSR